MAPCKTAPPSSFLPRGALSPSIDPFSASEHCFHTLQLSFFFYPPSSYPPRLGMSRESIVIFQSVGRSGSVQVHAYRNCSKFRAGNTAQICVFEQMLFHLKYTRQQYCYYTTSDGIATSRLPLMMPNRNENSRNLDGSLPQIQIAVYTYTRIPQ